MDNNAQHHSSAINSNNIYAAAATQAVNANCTERPTEGPVSRESRGFGPRMDALLRRCASCKRATRIFHPSPLKLLSSACREALHGLLLWFSTEGEWVNGDPQRTDLRFQMFRPREQTIRGGSRCERHSDVGQKREHSQYFSFHGGVSVYTRCEPTAVLVFLRGCLCGCCERDRH